ncbi:hypothetical protein NDU88_003919 [Pleurodeles waltl]|uniref:Uncharacterized protein n=1 Tax=Pleurodeles waltl TaxID=8319 RepID=A0AAV7TPU6_PLEWA|nr:hypothetical protein NDU88_003919 [Pleurodeles waltl]
MATRDPLARIIASRRRSADSSHHQRWVAACTLTARGEEQQSSSLGSRAGISFCPARSLLQERAPAVGNGAGFNFCPARSAFGEEAQAVGCGLWKAGHYRDKHLDPFCVVHGGEVQHEGRRQHSAGVSSGAEQTLTLRWG